MLNDCMSVMVYLWPQRTIQGRSEVIDSLRVKRDARVLSTLPACAAQCVRHRNSPSKGQEPSHHRVDRGESSQEVSASCRFLECHFQHRWGLPGAAAEGRRTIKLYHIFAPARGVVNPERPSVGLCRPSCRPCLPARRPPSRPHPSPRRRRGPDRQAVRESPHFHRVESATHRRRDAARRGSERHRFPLFTAAISVEPRFHASASSAIIPNVGTPPCVEIVKG